MSWIEDVQREIARAREAENIGNLGRARTSARRAAGRALAEYSRQMRRQGHVQDLLQYVKDCATDQSIPQEVREAADRLQARLRPDFSSPAEYPVKDALCIVRYVAAALGKDYNDSSAR
jgi:hypothetical protein